MKSWPSPIRCKIRFSKSTVPFWAAEGSESTVNWLYKPFIIVSRETVFPYNCIFHSKHHTCKWFERQCIFSLRCIFGPIQNVYEVQWNTYIVFGGLIVQFNIMENVSEGITAWWPCSKIYLDGVGDSKTVGSYQRQTAVSILAHNLRVTKGPWGQLMSHSPLFNSPGNFTGFSQLDRG